MLRRDGMSKGHPEKVIDALYAGDVRAVERYVDAGNINLVDSDGYTLLGLAATATDLSMRMVRMLLKRGADATVRLREGGHSSTSPAIFCGKISPWLCSGPGVTRTPSTSPGKLP